MALRSLNGSEFEPSKFDSFDDLVQALPWGNKWVKKIPCDNIPYQVLGILKFDSGLMIVTMHYKAFLKPGEKGYEHLIEALNVWVEAKEPTEVLYCVLTKRGFPELAIETEEFNRRWDFFGDRWIPQFSNNPRQEATTKDVNPLLAGRGGTRNNARSEDKVGRVPK